ncbi:dom-3 [Aphelenchoides avenae]|nr:dom-3 [Aphelenchus avenae]
MDIRDNTIVYELECDPSHYHGPFLPFSVPTPVGEFSLDKSRVPQLGRARVRYLHEKYLDTKNVHFDLTHGFSTYDPKEVNAELLEIILRWIKLMAPPGSRLKKVFAGRVKSEVDAFQVIHEADFVVWRGSLTRVACSPFEKDGDGWKVACCRFQNVIFMCEYDSEAKAQKKGNESERERLMTYWGHKFEQYITTDMPL